MVDVRRPVRPDEHPCIGACGLAFSSPARGGGPRAHQGVTIPRAWPDLEQTAEPLPLETHASMRNASSIFCAVVRCGLATLCS